MNLLGKRILIGIGGGIAVYRVAELTRLLKKSGMEVRCVMTRSACEFVSPLTFEALTGEEVHTELFDLTGEREMGHIQLARWADAVIIAPATSNLIARFAHGIADDLLTTIMQVCDKPVLLAPAMNSSMWDATATQHNINTLLQNGISVVGPEAGELACGESGAGRLSEPRAIISALLPLLTKQNLNGQHWVINAGPTVEAWDDVRLLTNRASGMLGAMLADLAVIKGAEVSLIAGPGTPETHPDIKRFDVESAKQMHTACKHEAAEADVFIATAAVSDFRFDKVCQGKLKRGDTTSMSVNMIANPDIVAEIAAMQKRPTKVIAFAAEASDHIEHARAKLVKKGVDAIIANDISNMGSDKSNGWWISDTETFAIESVTKFEFAQSIINHIMEN
ncbi:phosphopantothenoylcysteine decarboxylase / phosphopantothenate--cysteine ligase [Mariprofundus micogutta]|uniref:Coenzyme A biosynthesis bifunctional protein CoaBC n=1 Tax=Mariprofundus micogutta TaxID=1921010 RepID=A0A1L8CLE4_9PROT|nr:bifunctional phosphopantothenoylcysteine decarboxylase/phosphopantothenate--cysteine ligase CoaBC [Mariprofundus micogutta]GAV19721.1 phosphopantothenoylcysteine decarboxylase / phosphopantothenate--cysteine ligase [Mariprofundus micogutta]